MSDTHAYQASEAFSAALRRYHDDALRYQQEVIRPWIEQHPDTPPLWVRAFINGQTCVGFADPDENQPPPAGLSRNQKRVELIPARGKKGDPWREALTVLNGGPKVGPIFTQFEIDASILKVDHSRRYTPGILVTPGATYLTWGCEHPNPGRHLIPVPLSTYYAAVEAQRELEAASKAVSSTKGASCDDQ